MVPVQIAVIFTFTPTCRCTQPTPKQLPSLRLMSSVAQILLLSCSFKKKSLLEKRIRLISPNQHRIGQVLLFCPSSSEEFLSLACLSERRKRQGRKFFGKNGTSLSSFVRPWLSAADVGEPAHYWRVMPTDWSLWITNMYQEPPILGSAYCWMGPFDCVLKKKRLNYDRCFWPY